MTDRIALVTEIQKRWKVTLARKHPLMVLLVAVGMHLQLSALIHAQGNPEQRAWDAIAPYFEPPAEHRGELGTYRSPLLMEDGTPVQNAEQWKVRREEIRTAWEAKLGTWPDFLKKPKVEILESIRRENFEQRKIRFEWVPGQTTTDTC